MGKKAHEDLTPKGQVKTFSVTFTVTVSTPELRGLRAFLEGNHYEFLEEQNGGNGSV